MILEAHIHVYPENNRKIAIFCLSNKFKDFMEMSSKRIKLKSKYPPDEKVAVGLKDFPEREEIVGYPPFIIAPFGENIIFYLTETTYTDTVFMLPSLTPLYPLIRDILINTTDEPICITITETEIQYVKKRNKATNPEVK